MTVRHAFISGCVLLVLLVPAVPSWACFCTAFSTFDELAKKDATVVVVGRIRAVGSPAEGKVYEGAPTSVDVEVEWVAKGSASAARLRIWDVWAGSDCGGALQILSIGEQAAFALTTADAYRRGSPELWELLEAKAPPGDFVVLTGGCGNPVRRLRSRREADRYIGKRIR